MKAYWGSGGIPPLILDIGTMWRSVVSFMPQPLYLQGKSPWYTFSRRLGGPQSQSLPGSKEENSLPLQGLESPIIQHVAQHYTTELAILT
jgi:hypothetical protein